MRMAGEDAILILPAALGTTHPVYRTPANAVHLQAIIGVVVVMPLVVESIGLGSLTELVVKIGSRIWDASVVGKITKFRESLT